MNNLLSYCGLVDAKIRASDIDLPVMLNLKIFSILTFYLFFLGSRKASRRKSVSASAVPPKTDESRLTRSRSTSTSVKVLDVMFTPVKVKSASRKKETEKLEESRLGKRYAVNPARKSYKIPK